MSNDKDLIGALAPLHIYRDFSSDSTVLAGTRVRGKLDNYALTVAPRAIDAVLVVLRDMEQRDPFVAQYRRDEEIEIHPVFGGATLPELLAWP